jgi:hypothetical protein
MLSLCRKMAVTMTAMLFLVTTAAPANNAEQVVFSTPGFVMNLTQNGKAATTPFGFWIWCAASAAPGSNGGYENANACQGSMYFYALGPHSMPVIGFVTEGPDGIYTMNIFQGTFAQLRTNTLNPAFVCQLTNDTPDPTGPSNGVSVACPFFSPSFGGGSGSADVTNAVVNVTGP